MLNIKIVGLVFAVSIFVVTGQILIKLALGVVAGQQSGSISFFEQIPVVLTQAQFWGAMLCLLVSGVIWIYVLRNFELSLAYPLTSLSYVIMMVTSHFVLGERITLTKLLGTLIIVLGIVVATWGGRLNGSP